MSSVKSIPNSRKHNVEDEDKISQDDFQTATDIDIFDTQSRTFEDFRTVIEYKPLGYSEMGNCPVVNEIKSEVGSVKAEEMLFQTAEYSSNYDFDIHARNAMAIYEDLTIQVGKERERSIRNRDSSNSNKYTKTNKYHSSSLAKLSPRFTSLSKSSKYTTKVPGEKICYPVSPPTAFKEATEEGLNNCLLVAGRGEMNRFVIHMYLKRRGTWSTEQRIPLYALNKRCGVYYKGNMFFVGGEEFSPRDLKLDKLYVYNIRTGALMRGPTLRVARSDASAISWKHSIYVAGGLNRLNKAMTHVEVFDTFLNTWRLLPPMKFKRCRAGITTVKNFLYLIGGFTTRCECFDLEYEHGWMGLPNLPQFCNDFSMIASYNDDQIIACSEYKPQRVCVLDKNSVEWRVMRTVGTPPETIQDSCKCYEELYVVDAVGKIHVLNLRAFTWDQTVNCPKSFGKVLHIANINFDELNDMTADKVTRDFN